MRYANLTEARECNAGSVIIWYQHQLGGQLADRWMWMAEKDGQVLDYHGRDRLVRTYLTEGEWVVVLCLHRDGTVSAQQAHAADAQSEAREQRPGGQ